MTSNTICFQALRIVQTAFGDVHVPEDKPGGLIHTIPGAYSEHKKPKVRIVIQEYITPVSNMSSLSTEAYYGTVNLLPWNPKYEDQFLRTAVIFGCPTSLGAPGDWNNQWDVDTGRGAYDHISTSEILAQEQKAVKCSMQ
ncbi:hypothetical protein COCC4DRAFT_39377 [Bipolaris maydis ATCC 48331]|uniref:Uncharacterized protein n=2 Tax=Cochliobolus heterostrophus TaxID=5016 RepID=M2UE27_COCH5|nr:uncharacterized protein COCC4DRAFT_39377 [Bipolaris maydis ATCC 48331]EMD86248.1 hypothetical protein COCHEDRAFT_1218468 [Bipolaris maydis C5]ENI06196.1 hypothetical protein COCC4DRAFT_39377 [Bipolaris maydis ATCC 48331]KAH7551690.1 hypothetical protein BM1_09324 [Bipolaris maydis]